MWRKAREPEEAENPVPLVSIDDYNAVQACEDPEHRATGRHIELFNLPAACDLRRDGTDVSAGRKRRDAPVSSR